MTGSVSSGVDALDTSSQNWSHIVLGATPLQCFSIITSLFSRGRRDKKKSASVRRKHKKDEAQKEKRERERERERRGRERERERRK